MCETTADKRDSTMTLLKTFKQAVFREAGAPLVLGSTELTLPGKGEVLVRVKACEVCFSETFAQNDVIGCKL